MSLDTYLGHSIRAQRQECGQELSVRNCLSGFVCQDLAAVSTLAVNRAARAGPGKVPSCDDRQGRDSGPEDGPGGALQQEGRVRDPARASSNCKCQPAAHCSMGSTSVCRPGLQNLQIAADSTSFNSFNFCQQFFSTVTNSGAVDCNAGRRSSSRQPSLGSRPHWTQTWRSGLPLAVT